MKRFVSLLVFLIVLIAFLGCDNVIYNRDSTMLDKDKHIINICKWHPIMAMNDKVSSRQCLVSINQQKISFPAEDSTKIYSDDKIPNSIKDIIVSLSSTNHCLQCKNEDSPRSIIIGCIWEDKDEGWLYTSSIIFNNPLLSKYYTSWYADLSLDPFDISSRSGSVDESLLNILDISNEAELIFYLDSDYIMKTWRIARGDLVLNSNKALNPDMFGKDSKSQPDNILTQIIERNFDIPLWSNINVQRKGFVELLVNTKEIFFDEKSSYFPLEMRNNTISVPLIDFFHKVIYSDQCNITNVNNNIELHTTLIHFLPYFKGSEEDYLPVVLIFNESEDYITVDGIEIPISFRPYKKAGYTMVPLIDFCNALGIEYHIRENGNSVLIGRFPRDPLINDYLAN